MNVAKNQIDGPLGGVSFEGGIISTPHGFILPDDIEAYKAEHLTYFRNALGTDVTVDELTDSYEVLTEGDAFEIPE